MDKLQSLPFEVGQCVESKTFQKGFRGAWFRGKIKKFTQKGVSLKYYDFSDEVSTLKVYQKVPRSNKDKEELMLRPHFPPVYCDGEVPDAGTLSEVIVVKNSVWKVGDLVDWSCDNAYWSGKITRVHGDDKIEIQSPPPPFGEGLSYEAFCEGLRPSLEWSLKDGWKVPVPRGGANYSPCARLIHPLKQGKQGNEGKLDVENSDEHTLPYLGGSRSKEMVSEKKKCVVARGGSWEKKRDVCGGKSGAGKGSCADDIMRSHVRTPAESAREELASEQESLKRIRLSKTIPSNSTNCDSKESATIPLNSTNCDSIESALIDYEELLNRVKWIKRILNPSEPGKPCWKFFERRPNEDRTGGGDQA